VTLSTETLQLFGEPAGFYFVIWYRDGSILNRSANAPSNSPPPSRGERDTLPHYRTRGDYREALHCSGIGDCAMAGRSVKEDLAATHAFGWKLTGAGVTILALGFGLGWLFIGRAIRPIGYIGNAATRIASGNLSERIDVGDLDDELGRLAAVLNSTFGRLEAAFARQREFTSNAAHELRTPLSILISEAQTTLARQRTADEYRETVEGGLETAQQMRKITETLLELARFDAADPAVSRAHIDLADIAARCIERLKPLADKDGIPIRRNLASVHALVAPDRMDVVVSNLLSNALYYNRPGGEIAVTTACEDGRAVLKVSDTGIGIDGDDLARIFDRFYRADKARSRSRGHSGLGLAICKTIIEAENGEITVMSVPNEGTTFTIRFVSTAVRPPSLA
jgi:heavy metal sensor kinase